MLRDMATTGTQDERAVDASAAVEAVPRPRSSSAFWFTATAMLAFAGLVSFLGSNLIAARFPDRPRPRDLLFEILPSLDVARYAADIAILIALVLLLVYALRRARAELPGMIMAFAIFYALRAAIMVLTPLALAHGDGDYYALLPIVQNGDISGHAGAALLCYLLVDPAREPRLRRLLLGLAVVESAALLLSRSHYSIDIVGGLLLAYFVWREWTGGSVFAHLKRLLVA